MLLHHATLSVLLLALSLASGATIADTATSVKDAPEPCKVPAPPEKNCPLKKKDVVTKLKATPKQVAKKEPTPPPVVVQPLIQNRPAASPPALAPAPAVVSAPIHSPAAGAPTNPAHSTSQTATSSEKNIITIDQRKIVLNEENRREERLEDALEKSRARAEHYKDKAESYQMKYSSAKRSYRLLKEKCQSCSGVKKEEAKPKRGGEGYYLGLVLGVGPDGIDRQYQPEEDLEIVNQDYQVFFGGRLMGVSADGYAAGIQVMTNSAISVDINFRFK